MSGNYDRDRVAWTVEQGKLLRERRLDQVDRNNVAAEIERLGAGDLNVLRERVRILLTALLRWAYQVDLRSTALASTIVSQRHGIEQILSDSAGLRSHAEELVIDVYPEAKRLAVMESGLFEDSFPAGLPFLTKEVFDIEYLPDPFGDDEIRANAWWRPGKKRMETV